MIFVTVLKEHAFDAFGVRAYDHLVKPLDSSRFRRTMDRAVAFLERRMERSIIVRRGISCEVVLLSQIVYCEVLDRKIYIHQKEIYRATVHYIQTAFDFKSLEFLWERGRMGLW